MVTHYEKGVTYEPRTEGWRVTAPCGLVLRGYSLPAASDTISNDLHQVDCEKCRDLYSLEFLAEVP